MKTTKPLLALFVIVFVLSGCQFLTRGPDEPGLISGTVYMQGVLSDQVQIRSIGYWRVSSSQSWLQANPTSGFGDATIDLRVDPSSLVPGEHAATLSLTRIGYTGEDLRVIFSFPNLRGTIVRGPEPASSRLSSQATRSLPTEPGRLLVGFRADHSGGLSTLSTSQFRTLASDVAAQGEAQLLETLPLANVAVVGAANMNRAAQALRNDSRVSYVEPDYLLELQSNDELWARQWGPQMIEAEAAWAYWDGTGVRIAILDNGLYPGHPDLDAKVISYEDMVADEPTSNCGTHGTHVAGIAAAETDNVEGVAGVAKGSGLVLYNVGFMSGNQCVVRLSAVLEAIDKIIEFGQAEVINMSFGGPFDSEFLHDAVKRAYAAGIVLVAAAGNDSTQPVLYPAAYPEVIAVSATNVLDERAYYSAYGPEIFVSAPGGDSNAQIWSTALVDGAFDYMQLSGTSMASPAVAATAAMVLSADPTLSPFQVSAILADTSVDLGSPGRDDEFGYGRIDAMAAVSAATGPSPAPDWFLLRTPSADFPVTEVEQFVAGYVGPGMFLEMGSDDDGDGVLQESGEYYGSLVVSDAFGGPYKDVVFYVEQEP